MSELVERTLFGRRHIFQIVVLASLIALGVNLLSAWFSDYFGDFSWLKWLTGGLLIFLGFLLFIRFLLQEKALRKKVEGVILLHRSEKRLVRIEDYDFSIKLDEAFRGAFLENSALRASWESEPMFAQHDKDAESGAAEDNDQAPKNEKEQKVSYVAVVRAAMESHDRPISEKSVLLEAVEFCILEFLSLHLSEYFGDFDDGDHQVSTMTRSDIPHILLENRILSLLTTPIEDRQIFLDSGMNKNPPKGEVHSIFGSDGSVYERFDLRIPTKTRLLRPSPGCIELHHPRFVLGLRGTFHGFGKNLPRFFKELYVGEPSDDIDPKIIQFEVVAELRSSALLRINGWEYYRWLDSFVRYFEDHVSFDAFLDRIEWASTSSQMRATLVRERLKEKTKAAQQENAEATSETAPRAAS